MEKIIIEALVEGSKEKVWDYYTNPKHIVNWNFADPSWHCPHASNELEVGGKYLARMEARDGSFGFDFEAIYTDIVQGEHLAYGLLGRQVIVTFEAKQEKTLVTICFDPETENPIDLQRKRWQAILDNFKKYVENS
jgi:uncharacterized protein YndB with AHSA1/START domain